MPRTPLRKLSPFGKKFAVFEEPAKLKLAVLGNFGFAETRNFGVSRTHFRAGKDIPEFSKWQLVKTKTGESSGASFFRLPNGKVLIVKPELETFPKIGNVGRVETSRARRMIPVLQELSRRGVNLEKPIGYIETKEGVSFYAIEAVEGIGLSARLKTASSPEKDSIAKGMGKVLADLHNKGVAHSHPHEGNWIINGTDARLVDAKAVLFKEDFPHTFKNTKRVLTWEEIKENDRQHVLQMALPKELHKAFVSAYQSRIKK